VTLPERARTSIGLRGGSLSDAVAFTDAVRDHVPRMVRLAALISPYSAPDDVVQDALIRAWRYRGTYDARLGSVSAWLLGIVANEARRAARRHRAPIAAQPPAPRPSVEDRLDIDAAVRRLPPRQRLAVDCFYYAHLSIAETAAVMECSEGTVKSTLADARERLRSAIKERT
jgi:RNA polymerase sigma-70 factor (ECF subfamily)